jgi:hypothetical protein
VKILPVRTVGGGAGGRTDGRKESRDRHVEDNNRSSQFCERAKKAMDTKPITIIDVTLLRVRNTVYGPIKYSDMALL